MIDNPKQITPWSGGKSQYLPCPICDTMTLISRTCPRVRCSKCGTKLLAVRVKQNVKGGRKNVKVRNIKEGLEKKEKGGR